MRGGDGQSVSYTHLPYAKALAAMVSSASGVPAVMIPEIELDAEDVMRIDYKPPEKNEE